MSAASLFRYEWFKTRRRPAFLVTLALFTAMDLFGFGYNLFEALRDDDGSVALPAEWSQILGEASFVPLVFASVVVILLVASEFSWRTARQNVIDGLSRSRWYWGKALIAAAVVAVFVAVHVGLGAGLSAVGTPVGTADVVTGVQLAALGGTLLSGLGYASFALLVATLTRSTGAAMAVWFFYVTIAEGILRAAIGFAWEGSREALGYFPIAAFNRVRDYLMYDPAALEAARARRAAMEAPPPEVGDPVLLALAASAWILFFVLVGWALFRRRDL